MVPQAWNQLSTLFFFFQKQCCWNTYVLGDDLHLCAIQTQTSAHGRDRDPRSLHIVCRWLSSLLTFSLTHNDITNKRFTFISGAVLIVIILTMFALPNSKIMDKENGKKCSDPWFANSVIKLKANLPTNIYFFTNIRLIFLAKNIEMYTVYYFARWKLLVTSHGRFWRPLFGG